MNDLATEAVEQMHTAFARIRAAKLVEHQYAADLEFDTYTERQLAAAIRELNDGELSAIFASLLVTLRDMGGDIKGGLAWDLHQARRFITDARASDLLLDFDTRWLR